LSTDKAQRYVGFSDKTNHSAIENDDIPISIQSTASQDIIQPSAHQTP